MMAKFKPSASRWAPCKLRPVRLASFCTMVECFRLAFLFLALGFARFFASSPPMLVGCDCG